MTRAGLKETSTSADSFVSPLDDFHAKMFCTSFSITWKLSQLRTADSKRTRMENGS